MPWTSGLQARVIEGADTGEVTPLSTKRMMVGRSKIPGTRAEGWVLLSDKAISRRHLELVWDERQKTYVIYHLSRTNQTSVDDINLDGSVEMRPGQRIGLGDSVLLIEPAHPDTPEPEPQPLVSPRANWELTETISRDDIAQALAEVEGAAGAGLGLPLEVQPPRTEPEPTPPPSEPEPEPLSAPYTLVVLEGPDREQRIPVYGGYITVGRNNLPAQELFRDQNAASFDQSIELSDLGVTANHFLLRWNDSQGGFGLRKNPSAPPLSLGRVIEGHTWMTQLEKKPAIFKPGDILVLGESTLQLEITATL